VAKICVWAPIRDWQAQGRLDVTTKLHYSYAMCPWAAAAAAVEGLRMGEYQATTRAFDLTLAEIYMPHPEKNCILASKKLLKLQNYITYTPCCTANNLAITNISQISHPRPICSGCAGIKSTLCHNSLNLINAPTLLSLVQWKKRKIKEVINIHMGIFILCRLFLH